MSNSHRTAAYRLSLLACAAWLSACGGGGDGGGGDGGLTPPGGLVSPASVAMPQAQMLAGRAAQLIGLGAGASVITQQLYTLATSNVASSGTQACAGGGSVSYSRTDADASGTVTTGDSISLAGSDCRVPQAGGTTTLDGRVEAQVTLAKGGTPYLANNLWNLRTRHTYTALTASANGTTVRLNGLVDVDDTFAVASYRFTNFVASAPASGNVIQATSGEIVLTAVTPVAGDATRYTYQFNNLAVQTNLSGTEKINLTIAATGSPQLRLNASAQVIGGAFAVQLDKAKVTVTVTGTNQVRVDVDNNNDGTVDATQSLAWTALLAAGNP